MSVSVMLPDALHSAALHSAALHLGGHTEAVAAITDLVRRELERKRQRTLLAIQHLKKNTVCHLKNTMPAMPIQHCLLTRSEIIMIGTWHVALVADIEFEFKV